MKASFGTSSSSPSIGLSNNSSFLSSTGSSNATGQFSSSLSSQASTSSMSASTTGSITSRTTGLSFGSFASGSSGSPLTFSSSSVGSGSSTFLYGPPSPSSSSTFLYGPPSPSASWCTNFFSNVRGRKFVFKKRKKKKSSSSGSTFLFGPPSCSSSSPFAFCSLSGSNSSCFTFGSTSSSLDLSIGIQKLEIGFGSGSPGCDQMDVDDNMTDVTNPSVPTFAQPANPLPAPTFVLGNSPAAQPSAIQGFQFGGRQNLSIPRNPSPFQSAGNLESTVPGGSFSSGSGVGDKSHRRLVKVKVRGGLRRRRN